MSGASVVTMLAAARPDVVALAAPLSLAVRVDPALVRAVRLALLPGSDTSLELDLWSSELVQVRSGADFTLRAAVVAELWGRLPARADELRRLWALYREVHAGATPLVQLEERLAYLARLDAIGAPDDDGRAAALAIDDALRGVVAAMADREDRRRDLAAWASRALSRLPAVVRQTEGARILAATAAAWVATSPALTALPPSLEGAALARRLAPGGLRGATRPISVRRTEDLLELAAEPRDPPWTVLEAAAAPSTLTIDVDRTITLPAGASVVLEVGPDDVVVGDGDGRQWRIPALSELPDLSGVLSINGVQGHGYLYILERGTPPPDATEPRPDLACTSASNVTPTWRGGAYFASGSGLAEVIAYDEDSDVALLEVSTYGDCAPVELADDATVNAVWRTWTADGHWRTPSRGGARSWHGRVAAGWPALRVAGPDGDEALPRGMQRPGLPLFVDGKVIGHLTTARPADGFAFDVYVSCADRDREIGDAIVQRLRLEGLTVGSSLAPAGGGEVFEAPSRTVLASARTLVVCASEAWRASREVSDELPAFLAGDDERDRRVVGVLLDDSASLSLLANHRTIPWGGDVYANERAHTELLDACSPHRTTSMCPARLVRWWLDQHRQAPPAPPMVTTTSTGEPIIPVRLRASATSPQGTPQLAALVAPGLLVTAAGSFGTGVEAEAIYPDSSPHRARGVFLVDGVLGLALDDELTVVATAAASPPATLDETIGARVTPALLGAILGATARPRVATLVLPEPIATAGLLSTRVARAGDGAARFVEHLTTGPRPWTVKVVVDAAVAAGAHADDRLPGVVIAIRVEPGVAARPRMFFADLADGPGLGGHSLTAVADACHRAAAVLRTEVGVDLASRSPRGGITLVSRPARGFTTASVVREAVRLAAETLAGLAGAGGTGDGAPGSTFHLHVPGAGARDVRELEAWLVEGVTGSFRVVGVDPETDVVEVQVGAGDSSLALLSTLEVRRAAESLAFTAYLTTEARDVLHGRFGLSQERRGLRLIVDDVDQGDLVLWVHRAGGAVRGHVTFWLPSELVAEPIRVRAVDGEASVRVKRGALPYAFTVGALVEDEAVALEARVFVEPAQPAAASARAQAQATAPPTEVSAPPSRLLSTLAGVSPFGACAITADGERIVSGSDDGQLLGWSAAEPSGAPTPLGTHGGRITSIRLSDSQRLLVSTSTDHLTQVRDATSGTLRRILPGHAADVLDAAISHDDRLVVTASEDRSLRLWDAETGEPRGVLEGHDGAVNACAIAPGDLLVSASADRTIQVRRLPGGTRLTRITGVVGALLCCAVSADGHHVITGSADWRVRVWSLPHGEIVRTLEGHTNWVTAVAVTPDGRHVVSASNDHTIKLWDLASGECLETLTEHTGPVHALAISADGRRLVSASEDRTLRLWSLDDLVGLL